MERIDLNKLATEERNKNTLNIDKVSTMEMVKLMNMEDKKVAIAVEKELENIAVAIDKISENMKKGGRLIYIGAGTSGRLGVLDAAECPPTYGISKDLIQGIIAGGFDAMFNSKEGAEDSEELGRKDLESKNINENDSIVGLTASGRTPYVMGALKYAKSVKAFTASITCSKISKLIEISDVFISPLVGAEVITGSTRLKSGSAQKLVLNMISTGVMIKLGKVYGNLMVDVKTSNKKLVERAKKIVCEATDCDLEKAVEVLEETSYNVKLSIFMILSKLDINEARKILDENKGYIAKALISINK